MSPVVEVGGPGEPAPRKGSAIDKCQGVRINHIGTLLDHCE